MAKQEYFTDWVLRAQKIAHLGIWDQDPISDELWWSDETFRILGLDPRTTAPSFDTFLQMAHPDDRALIVKQTELALKSDDNPYKVDYRIIRSDKSERILHEEALIERDEKGTPIKITGIIQDITERKQSERKIKKYARELEQANKEVKQFAYIISHDLRAPLVNIKGFSAELRYGLDEVNAVMESVLPHLNEAQKESVNTALEEDIPEAFDFIESSVNRMDGFINSLLKLSRLGRHELKPVQVDLSAVVEAALKDIAHQIEERKAKVTIGPLPSVIADQTGMEQIIGNLLNNAVKYWEPTRPLKLEITSETTENETVIHIRDNGRGIAEDDMDKVFAPFRRAGEENVPGDGMGLAYVQTMVRRHGGRIKCASEYGTGTTFTFTIAKAGDAGKNE